MVENEKWMREFQAPLFNKYDKLEKHLKSGIVYGAGRDDQNRPFIFYSVRRALDLGISEETQIDILDFVCGYTIYHAMVPGKVETYKIVLYFGNTSLIEIPINMLRIVAQRLKQSYKLRVHNIVAVNVDWRIKYACNFLYKILDPRLTDKIKILSDNGSSYFTSVTSKDRIQRKYGGSLPDKNGDFFPPRYN